MLLTGIRDRQERGYVVVPSARASASDSASADHPQHNFVTSSVGSHHRLQVLTPLAYTNSSCSLLLSIYRCSFDFSPIPRHCAIQSRTPEFSSTTSTFNASRFSCVSPEHIELPSPTVSMVNPGRVACIFTPFALSVASLVCLILIFLGGTSEHNKTLGSFYFLKVSASHPMPNKTNSL